MLSFHIVLGPQYSVPVLSTQHSVLSTQYFNPMSQSFVENYRAKHRHPVNKLCHTIGIPMIVISLPLFFFSWRWALALFIIGWILQFVGHAIEGNQPAFFKNPVYLLIGPLWLVRRAASALGLARAPSTKPTK